jgi:hypothetical protein
VKILSRRFIELLAATGSYMVTIKCVIREAEFCSEICDQVRLLSSFFSVVTRSWGLRSTCFLSYRPLLEGAKGVNSGYVAGSMYKTHHSLQGLKSSVVLLYLV